MHYEDPGMYNDFTTLVTFAEWCREQENRYDVLPDWWHRGRTRRLAEYGSIISGRIAALNPGDFGGRKEVPAYTAAGEQL